MRAVFNLVLAASLCAWLAGCFEGPKVVQGTVVRYDAAAHVLVVQDELPPHGELTLDTTAARLGSSPSPGSVVRVAYHEREGRLAAGRVMSVTARR